MHLSYSLAMILYIQHMVSNIKLKEAHLFNRPAMIMYGINSIRELVGPRVKMELILDNPVCTIDK